MINRTNTKKIMVGNVQIGGQDHVVIQSMTTTKTHDIDATLKQINSLVNEGCELVRVAVLDEKDVSSLPELVKLSPVPLVADIHFSYLFALKVMDSGIKKIRINPGNITDEKQLKQIIDKAKEKNIVIRIGVNSGSIPLDLIDKYKGATIEGMLEACDRAVKLFEKYDFRNIIISLKATNPLWTIKLYEKASKMFNYPLHLGVTEAGTLINGTIKSCVGLSSLLINGIGDTIRISLTEDPIEEVRIAKKLLMATGVETNQVDVIACPTCGRLNYNLFKVVREIEEYTKNMKFPLKISILGCIVNGIGEGKEADIGIAGGNGKGLIFKKGKIYKNCKEEDLVPELKKLIDEAYKEYFELKNKK